MSGPSAGAADDNIEIALAIPAYNAASLLPLTLPAAQVAARGASIFVVDDNSTDQTAEVATALGATVIHSRKQLGPAEARNLAVAAIEAEIVLFLDADCRPHPDVVDKVRSAFRADPELVSLTGSYDTDPPAPGFFSQYMNLRHHFVHQRAQRVDATFWAGCGAVRRSAFLEVGGFDGQRYPRPQIEDIELGLRLRRVGTTRLDPDLQVTHLKRWRMFDVVRTDIFQRAVPWSRLILESGALPNDLNLQATQRIAALLSPLVLVSPALIAFAAWSQLWFLGGAATAVVLASLALQTDMVRFFLRLRGARFAAGAWFFHQVHLFYSSATFVVCAIAASLSGRRKGASHASSGKNP